MLLPYDMVTKGMSMHILWNERDHSMPKQSNLVAEKEQEQACKQWRIRV